MNDLMLDIETLGTDPGCQILSIGAVRFDPFNQRVDDEPGQTFYIEINRNSYDEHWPGQFHQSPETLAWWATQPTPPPDGDFTVLEALRLFFDWLDRGITRRLWANSPGFDVGILKKACQITNLRWPIEYWKERDVRTLVSLAAPDPERRFVNTHNALDDAINQAHLVCHCYHLLRFCHDRTTPNHPIRNPWKCAS